jgi:hypothetical protein
MDRPSYKYGPVAPLHAYRYITNSATSQDTKLQATIGYFLI